MEQQEKSVQDLYKELDGTTPTPNEDNEVLNSPEHEPEVPEEAQEEPNLLTDEPELNLSQPEQEAETPEEPAPEPEAPPAEAPESTDGVQVDALEEAKRVWLEAQKPPIDTSDLDQIAQTAVQQPAQTIPGEAPTINLDDAIKAVAEEHGEDAALAAAKMIQAVAPQIQQTIEHTNLQQMTKLNQQSAEAQQYYAQCKDRFYTAFPDLNNHTDLVGLVTQQVSAENPQALPHQLLNEIGKRTTAAIEQIKEQAGVVGSKPKSKTKVDELGASPPRSAPDRVADMKVAEQEKLSDSQKHLIDMVNFVS